jgi:uncharacterized protein YggE
MLRYAILLVPALVYAQTAPNSVTVTASRNTNAAPDQAAISVAVNTPTTGTIDDAVAALQGSGVSSANFTGVSTVSVVSSHGVVLQLQWSFSVTTDLTLLKTTLVTLTGVQQAVAAKNNGTAVSFSVQGTQVSQKAAQAQPCSLADLMSDARAQAAKLASAANLTVGSVLAVSGATASTATSAGSSAFSSSVSQPVCSVTVKFALTGGI